MRMEDITKEFDSLPEGAKDLLAHMFDLASDDNGGLDPELVQILSDGAKAYQAEKDKILERTARANKSTSILQFVSRICEELRSIIYDGGHLTEEEIWQFEFRAWQCSLVLHKQYTNARPKIEYAMPAEAKPPKAKTKAAQ